MEGRGKKEEGEGDFKRKYKKLEIELFLSGKALRVGGSREGKGTKEELRRVVYLHQLRVINETQVMGSACETQRRACPPRRRQAWRQRVPLVLTPGSYSKSEIELPAFCPHPGIPQSAVTTSFCLPLQAPPPIKPKKSPTTCLSALGILHSSAALLW